MRCLDDTPRRNAAQRTSPPPRGRISRRFHYCWVISELLSALGHISRCRHARRRLLRSRAISSRRRQRDAGARASARRHYIDMPTWSAKNISQFHGHRVTAADGFSHASHSRVAMSAMPMISLFRRQQSQRAGPRPLAQVSSASRRCAS